MNRFNLNPPITLSWAMKANMGLFMAMVLVTLVHTYMILQSQQFHGLFIDVAGRQRMLYQKHVKEVLLTAQGTNTDYGRTRQVLEQSLRALLYGGPILLTLDNGTVKNLPPAPTDGLQRSLKSQEILYGELIKKADTYLGISRSGQDGVLVLQEVLALNERLQALAQEGVFLFRQYANERFYRQLASEVLIALFVMGLWALLARQVVRAREEAEQNQMALGESEERMRTIIESSSDVIFLKDLEGRYLMANEATAKVLGRSVEDILGKRDDELFEKKSADIIMEIDRRVMDSGNVEATEELLTVNGQGLWYSSIKAPYRDSNGKVLGLVGIVRDITEKKQAEFALRESEQRFRNLVAASKDPIFHVGTDQSILYVSPAVEAVFGYAPQEWTKELVPKIVHPSSRSTFEYVWEYFKRHGKFSEELMEISWIRKDGTILHTDQQFANLYDDSGAVTGFLVIARDTTERKKAVEARQESEERFRKLVAASKDPIFYVGTHGKLIYGSPAVEKVFGYPLSEWTNENAVKFLHPSSVPTFEQFWKYFEKHGVFSEDSLEITWIKKDGTLLHSDQRYSNVYDQQGKVSGFLTISRDITDRKRAEEALLESREEIIKALRQSDSMKSALLSSISHEIRTPLAAIKAMVYSSPDGQDKSTALIRNEFLDGMNQEIEYLNRMVDNLLDMSRLESGKVVPIREWFLIEDLIEGAIQRVGKALEHRKLDLALDDTLPPVFVDGIEIQQVLVNLLDNAVKYSRVSSSIRLAVINYTNMIEIRVTNQGDGIPEDERERVFERFYRSSSEGTRQTRGTGLGLAICKGIVESHQGKIWIDSDVVKEVTVTVQLPVDQSLSKQYSLV